MTAEEYLKTKVIKFESLNETLEFTVYSLTQLMEDYHESELKKLRVADVMRSCTHDNKTNYCNTDGSYSHKVCDDCNETLWD